jgi:flagellar assembly factor FliW
MALQTGLEREIMANKIATGHFGELQFEDQDIILCPRGLPGFETLRNFLLVKDDNLKPLTFLQSIESPTISFPLINPGNLFPEYRWDLPSEQIQELGLSKPEDGIVYCIVTIAPEPEKATVNLFAPLIVNPSQRKAVQVILMQSAYRTDEPLLRSA